MAHCKSFAERSRPAIHSVYPVAPGIVGVVVGLTLTFVWKSKKDSLKGSFRGMYSASRKGRYIFKFGDIVRPVALRPLSAVRQPIGRSWKILAQWGKEAIYHVATVASTGICNRGQPFAIEVCRLPLTQRRHHHKAPTQFSQLKTSLFVKLCSTEETAY